MAVRTTSASAAGELRHLARAHDALASLLPTRACAPSTGWPTGWASTSRWRPCPSTAR